MAVGGTAHLAALASLSALEVAAWSELILAVKLYCCTLSTDYQVCLHLSHCAFVLRLKNKSDIIAGLICKD